MGLFSTKRKHYVDTSVVRLVEDESVPNSEKTALVESIFSEDTTVVEAIKRESIYGSYRNFEKMYDWAKIPNNYYYGLPNATLVSSDDARPMIVPAIQADISQTGVVLDYYFFRPLNNVHAGWKHLYENMGYVRSTNKIGTLTASVGFDCYLNKMVAVHESSTGREIEQDSIGTWEASAESGETPDRPLWDDHDATGGLVTSHEYRVGPTETESVEIHYSYLNAAGTAQYAFIVLNLSSYDTDQEYHQAKYHYILNGVTYTGYWTYDHLTGTHTAVNNVYAGAYISAGTYFPIAIFRREDLNQATTALEGTAQYTSSVELLKHIGLDYREISDSMHQDADIGDIDQAVMMMAVPIDTTNQAELRYLFDYFSNIHDNLPTTATDGTNLEAPNLQSGDFGLTGGPNKSYAIDIQDADFRITLSFQGITKRYKSGNMLSNGSGVVGEFVNFQEVLNPYNIPFRSITGASSTPAYVASRNQRIFRKQITVDVFEEITVDSPQIRYHIYRNKGAEAGANDGRMLIPIDYNIAKNLSFLDKEELYYRSMHFVFNSHVVQTIKWYQRGAFRILLLIVAVILAFYGSDMGFKLWIASVAGFEAVLWVLIKFIVGFVVVGEITKVIFNKIAEMLGPEVAMWIAVITAVIGGVKIFKSGKMLIAGTAENFLWVANGLSRGAGQAFANKIEDLTKDYEEFELLKDEWDAELQRGKDLLGTDLDIDPFVFISAQPLFVAGEKPEDYFDRTVHSGNVGVQSLNIVQNFVSVSLTLPTIEETIEENSWA